MRALAENIPAGVLEDSFDGHRAATEVAAGRLSVEFLFDRVVEVFCRITARTAPPISDCGPYFDLAKTACQIAGDRASVTDHARRWVANRG